MSRVPASETLEIFQGGTLDETWDYLEPDGSPTDFTGYTAELRIAKDSFTAPVLTVTTTGSAPPAASKLIFSGNTLRIYLKDEDTDGLTEDQFVRSGKAKDGFEYAGLNTLLFTNAAGETTVENLGPVIFRPIAEP